MKTSIALRKSQIFQAEGSLAQVADGAAAAGYQYFSHQGNVFELEAGRTHGSSLGLHAVRVREVTE